MLSGRTSPQSPAGKRTAWRRRKAAPTWRQVAPDTRPVSMRSPSRAPGTNSCRDAAAVPASSRGAGTPCAARNAARGPSAARARRHRRSTTRRPSVSDATYTPPPNPRPVSRRRLTASGRPASRRSPTSSAPAAWTRLARVHHLHRLLLPLSVTARNGGLSGSTQPRLRAPAAPSEPAGPAPRGTIMVPPRPLAPLAPRYPEHPGSPVAAPAPALPWGEEDAHGPDPQGEPLRRLRGRVRGLHRAAGAGRDRRAGPDGHPAPPARPAGGRGRRGGPRRRLRAGLPRPRPRRSGGAGHRHRPLPPAHRAGAGQGRPRRHRLPRGRPEPAPARPRGPLRPHRQLPGAERRGGPPRLRRHPGGRARPGGAPGAGAEQPLRRRGAQGPARLLRVRVGAPLRPGRGRRPGALPPPHPGRLPGRLPRHRAAAEFGWWTSTTPRSPPRGRPGGPPARRAPPSRRGSSCLGSWSSRSRSLWSDAGGWPDSRASGATARPPPRPTPGAPAEDVRSRRAPSRSPIPCGRGLSGTGPALASRYLDTPGSVTDPPAAPPPPRSP